MAEDGVARLGTLLEELGARFELVVEAVSGFGGRLDSLREELFGQFAEVGSQIRFLSDQIAENRMGIAALRADLSAEMVRLGEALGKTRVEFREQMGAIDASVREHAREPAPAAAQEAALRTSMADREAAAETAQSLKREIASAAELAAKKLGAEIGKTNKAVQNLARKFDRFDDRITVETRDHGQRLRKLERKARG
ncbi:MAG TPA: hypothetical protein VEC38_06820 [Candidatus Binataceae bacterium]|nr:hypothetical protein [Candidatus Binataceae bacterium]